MTFLYFLLGGCFIVGSALIVLIVIGKRADKKRINQLPRDPKFWDNIGRKGGSQWDGSPICVDERPIYNLHQLQNN